MAREQILLDIPAEYENNIFGGLDVHLKKIERNLDVDVIVRDGSVKVEGESGNVAEAKRVFTELLELAKREIRSRSKMLIIYWHCQKKSPRCLWRKLTMT